MRAILIPILLFAAFIAWRAQYWRVGGREERQPAIQANQIDTNHIAMARWIDRQLLEGWVGTEQTETAKQLLAQFYGDDPKEIT